MNKIRDYIKATADEIKAITWPTRKRVYTDTTIVLVALVFGGAVIALIDYGFASAFKAALARFGQL